MLIPGHVRISDVELRRQLDIPSIESQIRRARLRYAASLVKVAQPSVAALLGVGLRAPADWASMLLEDLEALREVCPLSKPGRPKHGLGTLESTHRNTSW